MSSQGKLVGWYSEIDEQQLGALFAAAKVLETRRATVEKFLRAYARGAADYAAALTRRDRYGKRVSDAKSQGAAAMIGMMALVYLLYPAISAAYYAGFESSGKQATLGKMAVGIKVTDTEGRRLTLGRALLRWLAVFLNYITLYVGYLIAAFTERQQGLHDMVVGTLVVDRWAYTAHPDWQQRGLVTVTKVILAIAGVLYGLMFIAVIAAIVVPMALQS